MMVYPPDVLSEEEARAWKDKTAHKRNGPALLTDHDYQILFARHGLIFVGWETYTQSLTHDHTLTAFYAEVYPL